MPAKLQIVRRQGQGKILRTLTFRNVFDASAWRNEFTSALDLWTLSQLGVFLVSSQEIPMLEEAVPPVEMVAQEVKQALSRLPW